MERIEYVEGRDARGVTQEWTDIKILKKMDSCICYSVGRLIRENKREIVLLPHWGDDPPFGCGEMVIPISNIEKRKRLK